MKEKEWNTLFPSKKRKCPVCKKLKYDGPLAFFEKRNDIEMCPDCYFSNISIIDITTGKDIREIERKEYS